MDCIFCKIAAGEIPAIKVFEDGDTLAFMDIHPLTDGHLLVIPKRHAEGIWDVDEASLTATMRTVRVVSQGLKQALGLDSLNLLQANGKWAAQSVPHLHFHLIPRHRDDGAGMDWRGVPGKMDAITALGDRIKAAVQ